MAGRPPIPGHVAPDRDILTRFQRIINPMEQGDTGSWLQWLRRKLELDEPEFLVSMRPAATGGASAHTLIALWEGESLPAVPSTWGGVWRIPYIEGVSTTFTLNRALLRVETPASSGSYVVVIEKSVGGASFSAVTVTTLTLTAGSNQIEDSALSVSITSGELVRIRFSAVGNGGQTFTVQLEGTT